MRSIGRRGFAWKRRVAARLPRATKDTGGYVMVFVRRLREVLALTNAGSYLRAVFSRRSSALGTSLIRRAASSTSLSQRFPEVIEPCLWLCKELSQEPIDDFESTICRVLTLASDERAFQVLRETHLSGTLADHPGSALRILGHCDPSIVLRFLKWLGAPPFPHYLDSEACSCLVVGRLPWTEYPDIRARLVEHVTDVSCLSKLWQRAYSTRDSQLLDLISWHPLCSSLSEEELLAGDAPLLVLPRVLANPAWHERKRIATPLGLLAFGGPESCELFSVAGKSAQEVLQGIDDALAVRFFCRGSWEPALESAACLLSIKNTRHLWDLQRLSFRVLAQCGAWNTSLILWRQVSSEAGDRCAALAPYVAAAGTPFAFIRHELSRWERHPARRRDALLRCSALYDPSVSWRPEFLVRDLARSVALAPVSAHIHCSLSALLEAGCWESALRNTPNSDRVLNIMARASHLCRFTSVTLSPVEANLRGVHLLVRALSLCPAASWASAVRDISNFVSVHSSPLLRHGTAAAVAVYLCRQSSTTMAAIELIKKQSTYSTWEAAMRLAPFLRHPNSRLTTAIAEGLSTMGWLDSLQVLQDSCPCLKMDLHAFLAVAECRMKHWRRSCTVLATLESRFSNSLERNNQSSTLIFHLNPSGPPYPHESLKLNRTSPIEPTDRHARWYRAMKAFSAVISFNEGKDVTAVQLSQISRSLGSAPPHILAVLLQRASSFSFEHRTAVASELLLAAATESSMENVETLLETVGTSVTLEVLTDAFLICTESLPLCDVSRVAARASQYPVGRSALQSAARRLVSQFRANDPDWERALRTMMLLVELRAHQLPSEIADSYKDCDPLQGSAMLRAISRMQRNSGSRAIDTTLEVVKVVERCSRVLGARTNLSVVFLDQSNHHADVITTHPVKPKTIDRLARFLTTRASGEWEVVLALIASRQSSITNRTADVALCNAAVHCPLIVWSIAQRLYLSTGKRVHGPGLLRWDQTIPFALSSPSRIVLCACLVDASWCAALDACSLLLMRTSDAPWRALIQTASLLAAQDANSSEKALLHLALSGQAKAIARLDRSYTSTGRFSWFRSRRRSCTRHQKKLKLKFMRNLSRDAASQLPRWLTTPELLLSRLTRSIRSRENGS